MDYQEKEDLMEQKILDSVDEITEILKQIKENLNGK